MTGINELSEWQVRPLRALEEVLVRVPGGGWGWERGEMQDGGATKKRMMTLWSTVVMARMPWAGRERWSKRETRGREAIASQCDVWTPISALDKGRNSDFRHTVTLNDCFTRLNKYKVNLPHGKCSQQLLASSAKISKWQYIAETCI